MLNAGMFSSLSCEWATPQWLFDELNAEFGFTIDVCAGAENAKVAQYYDHDALSREWSGVVWCNPPYGRKIGDWVRKGYESAEAGATVVMLLPSRTDTKWWHGYVMLGEMRFIKGRLKFGDAKAGAPFPSAIVVFRP